MTQRDLEKAEKAKNSARASFAILFVFIMIGWIYKELTKKYDSYPHRIKPQSTNQDYTIKVPTDSASNYNLDRAYLDALENTNSNNATSVETSERDSKPKSP